jgi:hypothetical protein
MNRDEFKAFCETGGMKVSTTNGRDCKHGHLARKYELCEMETKIAELTWALKESLELQSFYASLLNQYDAGKRIGFKTPEEWISRLKACKTKAEKYRNNGKYRGEK